MLVALSGVVVGAGLWLVQRADPLVAHPGVLVVPGLSLGAIVAVLVGVAPVFLAPPPLTAQNRAPILPEPVAEPAEVAA